MQSSNDILENIKIVITKSIGQRNNLTIVGIGCDATCSLVLLDKNENGFKLDEQNGEIFDIILWRDHRAMAETEEINSIQFKAHSYVGGSFSSGQIYKTMIVSTIVTHYIFW